MMNSPLVEASDHPLPPTGEPPRWLAPLLALPERGLIVSAWAGWGVLALVSSVIVATRSDVFARSVTKNYYDAAWQFVRGENMYADPDAIHGWLYLPPSAAGYALFAVWPLPVGEVLWRVVLTGLYAWGVWSLARLASRWTGRSLFPIMTLVSLPTAAGAIHNGQTNVLLGATFMLAAANLAQARPNRAAVMIALSLLAKPFAVAYLLLAGVLHRAMSWRVVAVMIVVVMLPLVGGRWSYVRGQYELGIQRVLHAAQPAPGDFSDLLAITTALGIAVPPALMTCVRLGAAVGVLGGAWWAISRLGRVRGAILTFVLLTGYLMVMNPRTEGVSYGIVAPACGVMLGWAMLESRRFGATLVLGAVALVLAAAHVPCGPVGWARPAATLVLLGYTGWWIADRWRGEGEVDHS